MTLRPRDKPHTSEHTPDLPRSTSVVAAKLRGEVGNRPTDLVSDYVRRAVAARSDQGLPEAVEEVRTLDQLAQLMSKPAQKPSRSVA